MSYSLIAHTGQQGTQNSCTTGAIDTTGANLIVLHVAWFSGGSAPTISDSKGNTYTALTSQSGGNIAGQLYYCYPPVVGIGHTFTNTAGNSFSSVQVAVWSGAAVSPFDQQNGAHAGTTSSLATGSVTPSENNELIVAGFAFENNSGGAISIGSSFTISDTSAYSGGNSEGGSMAYLVQTSLAAVNPTWNSTNNADLAATIATFKAAAGGTTPMTPYYYQQFVAGGGF